VNEVERGRAEVPCNFAERGSKEKQPEYLVGVIFPGFEIITGNANIFVAGGLNTVLS
jgi:hypothetical protein